MGPEETRLRERLKDALLFNVWWGPEAHKLTIEERAKHLNDALDQVDRGEGELLDFGDSRRKTINVDEFVAATQKEQARED